MRLARARSRQAPLIAWTIGFALFTAASLALLDGAARGWTAAPFRIYYLTGGVLVVAYLAVGELLLVLPGRTVTRLAAATMLFLTFAATAAVLAARIDAGELARGRCDAAERRPQGPVADGDGDRAQLRGDGRAARGLDPVGPPPARPAAAAGGGRGAA